MRHAKITDVIASIVVLAAATLAVWHLSARRQGEPRLPVPRSPLSLEGAALKGQARAPVGILEFSDFQCPFCARFARDILPALDKAYFQKGIAFLAVREAPLPIHPFARAAAEVAACAQQIGRFWDVSDLFFAGQVHPGLERVLGTTESLGLSREWLDKCRGAEGAVRVDEDIALMKSLGVSGTPSFFIGRALPDGRLQVARTLNGVQPFGVFRDAIESMR